MKTVVQKNLIISLTALAISSISFSSHANNKEKFVDDAKFNPISQIERDDSSASTAIGLGSGVVIGALLAGPIGAGVVGIIGAFIGDDMHDSQHIEMQTNALLANRKKLESAQIAYQNLARENAAQIAAIDTLQSSLDAQHTSALTHIMSNIQFKTASFLIEDIYKTQLDIVARQLRDNPNYQIQLSGFADTRGDSKYNQILSEQRNQAVKDYLLSQRVDSEQIVATAYGETQTAFNQPTTEKQHEDNFFDRRVMINLTLNETGTMSASANPNL